MNYEVVADREFPNYWRVEAIDSKTGDVYIAVFYGPDAKIRAEEYSGLKQRTEALEQRVKELERGEYICSKCHLRKDAEFEKGDF